MLADFFWGAGGDHLSAFPSPFGTHVDDVVGKFDDIEVVLYHDDRVASVDDALEHIHEDADVFEMQASGRLVEDIERFSRIAFRQFGGKFHPLAFPSRERCRGLPQFDVPQSHVLDGLDFLQDIGHVFEELHRLVDGHVEHIGDRLALIPHLQCLPVVAFAVAHLAGHHHIGQEVHLDGLVAVSATSVAPSPLHVEGEPPRFVSPDFRLRQVHEERADITEHPCICGRVRPWRLSDGRLVYAHHLVDKFQTLELPVRHGFLQRAVEMLRENGLQGLIDQRRLPRATHSCHHDEFSQWYFHVDVFQVVACRSSEPQALALPLTPVSGQGDGFLTVQVLAGNGMLAQHLVDRTLEHHFATSPSCFRSDVYDVVGGEHHVFVVFHHDDGVTDVAQLFQAGDESVVVALVEAYARFVEDIEHIDELRPDLCGQSDALALASRQ